MNLIRPTLPAYDALVWVKRPLGERARMVCESWAVQGYGSPAAVYALYGLKVVLYVLGWVFFCSMSPGLGRISTIGQWWLDPIAFQKAILWSMLFEGLGLGCGSGPLTGRYFPPVGGFLHFMRPGTTKLPLFPRMPLLGGARRSWFDAALYVALCAIIVHALCSPVIAQRSWIGIAILLPLLGLVDRTIFLAFRSEHYWTTTLCFLFAGNWIAGAKAVQLALWFWAGFSKLNHHFPAVVCVMTSNSPFTFPWLRRRMYRNYPDDLRPSRFAEVMAHAGTVLEMGVPTVLLFAHGGTPLVIGMVMMLGLHAFITSNVPMGVPIEWNVMVVYGAFALFWAHPDVYLRDLGNTPLAIALCVLLIGLPLLGNLVPSALSFLLSMRYYAGNWACSVWLFRGDSYRKLDKLKKSAPWVYDQLDRFYDRKTAVGMVGKVMGFRFMHLHGRALSLLIPKAVSTFTDYEYLDGEMIAGMVLGWNFGEGQLHSEALLQAIQAQCGFEPAELRCVFIEAQPLGRGTLEYRIADASSGQIERGELAIRELRERQPWTLHETVPERLTKARATSPAPSRT